MSTFLPRDDDREPIPALRLKPDGAQTLTLGSTSMRTATPFDARTRVIAVYASSPAFVRTGGPSVAASDSDHYLPAAVYLYFSLGDERTGAHSHLAAIGAEGDGTLHLSELE